MSGKLILVSGLSGSGKTTLIGGALGMLDWLHYLQTYTTRPMRPGEETSHEYLFVDQAGYDRARASSGEWDHTEYSGYSYGADAGAVKRMLAKGQTVICSVAPDLAVVQEMAELYGTTPLTIWIKTPPDVTKQRIFQDDLRDSRNEDFAVSTNFDIIFEPQGVIEADIDRFCGLIRELVR